VQKIWACAVSFCFLVLAAAQGPSTSAAANSDLLSMDQQIKIARLITKQAPPLTSGAFSIQMDGIVPADIELHSFPVEIEQLAPGLHGFGYVVVEEQIALVDQHTRKIKLVFPRWGE
jgi:hypothetical protein